MKIRTRFIPWHRPHGLWRAQSEPATERLLARGNKETGQVNLCENDLLPLTDALDVLTAFCTGGDWPRHLFWRSLASEMNGVIQFNDEKHRRRALSE